jgi:hypothetical protein
VTIHYYLDGNINNFGQPQEHFAFIHLFFYTNKGEEEKELQRRVFVTPLSDRKKKIKNSENASEH